MTRLELEAIMKADEIVCDVTFTQISVDANDLPVYKTEHVNKPASYKLIYTDPTSNLAILKDLDYVAPTV